MHLGGRSLVPQELAAAAGGARTGMACRALALRDQPIHRSPLGDTVPRLGPLRSHPSVLVRDRKPCVRAGPCNGDGSDKHGEATLCAR